MATVPRSWRRGLGAAITALVLGGSLGLVPVQAQTELQTQTGLQAVTTLAARGNPDAYRFWVKVNGKPVHWNKCDRIGFRVYTKYAPPRAIRQSREAVRRLNRASGLNFVFQGRSRVQASKYRRYARDTDLVIGWAPPRRSPYDFNGKLGLGSLRYVRREIVDAYVLLNSNKKLEPGFGRGPRYGLQGTIGQVLMHELGHAVNLWHVKDKAQIMHGTTTRKLATWGAGDRNGLVRVGKRRACFG